jgi:hypothetical protein
MDQANGNANPFLVSLFFIARCLIPLVFMLGVTYLLKKLGLVAESPPPPPDQDNNGNNEDEGGLAHGKA